MVRMYLSQQVFARGEELVYRVHSIDVVNNSKPYYIINLELVCGWDYLDEECAETGWREPEHFTEDVQWHIVCCYFVEESMLDALRNKGLEIVEDTLEFAEFL